MQPVNRAAAELLACLQGFAAEHTNPVLTVLGSEARLVADRKYPQPALAFGDGGWRAYYHYHADQPRAAAEHGHFHLFVRAPEQADGATRWAHLAGLGMDSQGQPVRWFAVNAWVTADAWAPRDWLIRQMGALSLRPEDDLLPAWLTAMISSYRDLLVDLLAARDRVIADRAKGCMLADVLQDRSLYQLAATPVDLSQDLSTWLAQRPTSAKGLSH